MVVVPRLIAEGITIPLVLIVAIDGSLLVQSLPHIGCTVQVAGIPPLHLTPYMEEYPMGDLT